MRLIALGVVAVVLLACGGQVDETAEPDCSQAYCSILSDMQGVRCVMHPAECRKRWDELCPPLRGFEKVCRRAA